MKISQLPQDMLNFWSRKKYEAYDHDFIQFIISMT